MDQPNMQLIYLKHDNDNSITKLLLTYGRSSYYIRFQSLSFVVKIVKISQLATFPSLV